MPDKPPIIVTKILVPKKAAGLYRRPRLLNFIHSQIERKLILISAAAGYGKTSLVADFAHSTELPVCWYSMDVNDRDPSVLVEYLVATLGCQFPNFGERTQALLKGGQALSGNLQPVVTTLVNEIYDSIPEYFVLVLDDYHLVADSRAVEDFFDLLLRYLPENCHIILASRIMPRLPLLRLAAYREVAGLGSDELRFTGAEIQGLLRQEYNLRLPDAAADELARESEGWITGILLTTQTFWRGMLDNLSRARGAPEQVFQYLATEVFARQPEQEQQFLLASSILHQMNADLCDSILETNTSHELLDKIEKLNLFVTRVEGQGTWYKYHHLFQEFLQTQFRQQDPQAYVRLHRRAAALFEANRNTAEAVHHYLQIEAYEEACDKIVASAEPLFEAGRVEALSRWIDALPRRVLEATPELQVTRARIHTVRGELFQASQLLRQAEGQFTAVGDRPSEAKVLIYQGAVSSLEGKYTSALDRCRRALELLPTQEPVSRGKSAGVPSSDDENPEAIDKLRAAAHRHIGVSLWAMGKLERARAELEDALAIYQALGDAYHIANVHQELGNCLRALGNVAGAHLHYQRSLALWEQIGNPATLANVLNSMAIGLHQRGAYDKCLELFQEALKRAREAGSWRYQGYILASIGDVHRDLGDYEVCGQLYGDALELATKADDGGLTVYVLDALGNTARLRGDWATARDLLRQASEDAERHQSPREQGQCETSMGILCHEAGETEEAVKHLRRALALLESSGARLDLARAELYLAQALHTTRRKRESLEHLKACLAACDAAGVDQFLVVEGQRAMPLLQDAVRRIEKRRLASLIGRIEAFGTGQLVRRGSATETSHELPRQPALEITAFGTGTIYRDSVAVTQTEWGAAQAREMFFYILAHPDRSKEQIGAVFWPDLSLARMTSTFHATLYRVRRAIGRDCIIYENERYRFNRALSYRYDVEEFESMLTSAELISPPSEHAAESYRQALKWYRGEYLDDVYSDWTRPLRDQLLHRYVGAASRLAEWYAGRQEYEKAASLYRQLLEQDNLREEAHRRLMECYVLAGERARALQHYERLVSLLDQELDAAPAPETIALFEQIQRGG